MHDRGNTEERAQRGAAAPGSGTASGPAAFVPLEEVQPSPRLELAALRKKLEGKRGRHYWRSLEELAESEELRRYIEREFPQAPRDMAPLNRREFFRVMGATLALAGASGCGYQPAEKIVPYIEQPEHVIPGKPLYYATAFERGGYGIGLLGETHTGRPVKLEGNPQHPASLGATDAFAQGSLLDLYDPDRSRAPRQLGAPSTWEAFAAAVGPQLEALRRARGAGLRLLVGAFTSPTLADQLQRFQRAFPQARIHQYEPAGRENVREGARLAFGTEVEPIYQFRNARRILSLDCNFLQEEPGSVRYSRDFIEARLVRNGRTEMNRLYAVESAPTLTGAKADHTLSVRPGLVEAVARAVAAAVGVAGVSAPAEVPGVSAEWIRAVAEDLTAHRGAGLVLAGAHQPPAVHALAHAMNQALGNVGRTVVYAEPIEVTYDAPENSIQALADDLRAGRVEALLFLSTNPVYTAPAELEFARLLDEHVARGKLAIHFGRYDDETGVRCPWHLPESHYLEAWGDVRAYDGTVSIVQPLITPLYATRSALELIEMLVTPATPRGGYEIVRAYWQRRLGAAGDFERRWHQMLVTGVVPNTQAARRAVTARPGAGAPPAGGPVGPTPPPAAGETLEILFRPDPTIWDGRFANNGWLQELPKPLSTLTWDNAVFISPALAEARDLRNGDRVELAFQGRTLPAAVWIVPGQPDGAVTLTLGYGRTRAGRIGNGMGFNAYALRTSQARWFAPGLELRKTGGRFAFAATQHHFSMEGRGFVRTGTPEELRQPTEHGVPAFMLEGGEPLPEHLPSLYPDYWPSDRLGLFPRPGAPTTETAPPPVETPPSIRAKGVIPGEEVPAWGMVIDLNACIGCGTCTIACQAENNIATVGKDQVLNNREMHWIRVSHYYHGDVVRPDETVFQPVPCMHCEKAPCEPVCPVEATSHSADGINEMTYNRCIGTRYCSNNCPYKVRRFNYLQYSDMSTPTIQMMRNPDVTVRARGVMEKCTYCVQRIWEARIEAEKEGRPIRDGDVVPACAQACPTQAIVFGDVADTRSNGGKGSLVRQLKALPINYSLLTELNTRPRTSYLANMRNPNPALEPPAPGRGGETTEGH